MFTTGRCVVIVATTLVLLVASSATFGYGFCFKCLFECPTSDAYGPACLRSAIPPWPICKFKTVDAFVEHAKDSATRCCGDDLSECKCPKKDTPEFMEAIDNWCKGVASCGCEEGEEDCPPALQAIAM
jgi:hypothetical protein